MTLIVENASKDLLDAFKSMAKVAGAKLMIKEKKPSKRLLEAIKEAREGKVEKFKDFDSYKKVKCLAFTRLKDTKTAKETSQK